MTDDTTPQFTIAIPTFRRPELLRVALDSVIRQRTTVPFEVLVIDNDPESDFAEEIAAFQARAASAHLRYIRNDKNIGMFGNWNKCLSEARSEWMTLLGDDDALHPDFLETILPYCTADCAAIAVGKSEVPTETAAEALPWLQARSPSPAGFKKINTWLFKIFNPIGTPAGFSFNRETALALGGYEPEFYPSSDYLFAKRLAGRGSVIMTSSKLAFVGIGDNASMRTETMTGFFEKDLEIRAITPAALNWFVGLMNIAYQGRQFGFSVSEITGISRLWDLPLSWLGFGFRVVKQAMLQITCKSVAPKPAFGTGRGAEGKKMTKMAKDNATRNRRKVVIFSEIEWGFLKQRHQILAEDLLRKGYEVEFVQKVPSRVPNPLVALKFLLKMRRDRCAVEGKRRAPVPAGLRLSYSRFLPPSNPLLRLFNRRIAAPYHARSLAGGTAYLFTPSAFELVRLRDTHDFKLVFDIIHNWWNLPWANPAFKQNATTLVKTANAVICDSKPLADHLEAAHGTKITLVTPGVGDFWVKKLAATPRATATVPATGPSVVFFGNLRENSDIELCQALGEAGITLDAYGTVAPSVRERLNGVVNFKPALPHEELLEAIHDYDFSILPYARDEFSKWISPAKYFEVVALGKPILTRSDLSHMPGWDELTSTLDIDAGALGEQLRQVQEDYAARGLAAKADALARENTWSHQLALIEMVIANA